GVGNVLLTFLHLRKIHREVVVADIQLESRTLDWVIDRSVRQVADRQPSHLRDTDGELLKCSRNREPALMDQVPQDRVELRRVGKGQPAQGVAGESQRSAVGAARKPTQLRRNLAVHKLRDRVAPQNHAQGGLQYALIAV